MKILKKYMYIGLPVLGVLFYLCYLHIAAIDMVYSDYIRLINAYLPDVWNPEKFFVGDLLTRIPANYLERIINVTFFGYSVTFDRVLGVFGFGLSAAAVGMYCRKKEIGAGWYLVIMAVMFSLNKWEMLYNGTGWAHFAAFACFFYNYIVLDRVYGGDAKKGDFVRLAVLPIAITLGIAGPYCAVYIMTLLLSYGFIFVKDCLIERKRAGVFGRKEFVILLTCAILPLLAYICSNSQAVYEHAGAVEGSLLGTFFQEPKFFLKFLLKAFASIVFGVEFISRRMAELPNLFLYVLGAAVFGAYVLALFMNFYYGIYKTTLMPLMFLAGGGMNHLIVLVSRWIFMKDTYGMSSRYALQYQVGVIGILLTFALVYKKRQNAEAKKNVFVHGLALLLAAMFLAGNLLTTVEEFNHGKHRKNYNMEVKEILLNFENEEEETLKTKLEYHKPGTKEALRILKENGWNIFKQEE